MKRLYSLIYLILILFLSSILIFSITRMMPVSPEEMLLASFNLPQTKENIALLNIKWGLDAPLYQQYFIWVKGMFLGNWGKSLISGIDIKSEFIKRLPFSLALGLGSLFLSSLLGFFLGYLAAIKKGFFEWLSRALSILSQSIPIFISSLIVIYIIGVKYGIVKFFTGNPWISTAIGIVLIAITNCGSLSRVARRHFLELSEKTYIKRLYANGFSYSSLMLKHGYKPVLHSLIGALIPRFAGIIGGSSVVEFAFTIPGINYFLIESIKNRDYSVIQAYLMLTMLWMFFVTLCFKYLQNTLDKRQSL